MRRGKFRNLFQVKGCFPPQSLSKTLTTPTMIRPSSPFIFHILLLLTFPLSIHANKPQTRAITEGQEAANLPDQPPSSQTAPVVSSAKDGLLVRYDEASECEADTRERGWQRSKSYSVDQCHNLLPHVTTALSVVSPATCANGTRASFAVYRYRNCEENRFGPAKIIAVGDEDLWTCIDASSLWSFAYLCEGIEEEEGREWFSPAGILAILSGLTTLGLVVGNVLIFCVCLAIVILTGGVVIRGLRMLGGMISVRSEYSSPPSD
jgi:hypothetical protein